MQFPIGRSLAGIVGSNPARGTDISVLWVLRVFRLRSLRRSDHSSRGVSECDREALKIRRPWPVAAWKKLHNSVITLSAKLLLLLIFNASNSYTQR
jgi:hypothetical protein